MTFISRFSPTSEHPGIGLSGVIPDPRLRVAVSLAGLGISLWVTAAALPAHTGIAALIALGGAGAAWLALTTFATGLAVPATIAVMAAGGAVVAVTDSKGLIFTGIAASNAAVAFDTFSALILTAAGPIAFALTALAQRGFPGQWPALGFACLAGLVAGGSRREAIARGEFRAQVAHAAQRAELARQEAELAAERNRLARELHDVLAHTLGALSIQLTAIGTLARQNAEHDKLLAQIEQGTQLVGAGLDEASQAVRALREDTTPLPAQLERLCELHQADLEITGSERGLNAAATLAFYRLAQEALTNAAKHAPGAPVTVRLAFAPQEVALTLYNAPPDPATPSPLHDSGGGYGLEGMRERVAQAGGHCHTGPAEDGGWLVAARIPY